MKSEKISELTTNRLSVYLRCLNTLAGAGIKTISSQALAEQFNLNSAQIRKDLGYFGEFGVRGVGYYVAGFARAHYEDFGTGQRPSCRHHRRRQTGNCARELSGHSRNQISPSSRCLITTPRKLGRELARAAVPGSRRKQIARVVKEEGVDVAVIAVPARAAQKVLNQVMAAGVRAVLNFAPASLSARLGVKVKTVDLTTSLESLSFFLSQPHPVW